MVLRLNWGPTRETGESWIKGLSVDGHGPRCAMIIVPMPTGGPTIFANDSTRALMIKGIGL